MKTKTKTPKVKPSDASAPAIFPVRLGLRCPLGRAVCVAGSFNHWQPTALQRDGDDWRIELKLPPGEYEYLFVIDDRWLPDPACTEGRANPFGGENSVLRVPAADPPVPTLREARPAGLLI